MFLESQPVTDSLSVKEKEEFTASSSGANISKTGNLHNLKSIYMEALLQKEAFDDAVVLTARSLYGFKPHKTFYTECHCTADH